MKKKYLTILILFILVSCGSPDSSVDTVDGISESEHRIFITSNSYQGHMGDGGGLTSADAICKSLATAAGLSKNYKAILSSSASNSNANERITLSGAIYLFNTSGEKTLVAANAVDFWATDSKDLLQAVNVDEALASVTGASVWTGSGYEGAVNTDHCNNWTSNNSGVNGFYGTNNSVDDEWIESNTDSCDQSLRLYCISQ